ncbi:MAG: hypothetical protein ABSF24_02950 [Candidatus Bathyarchaeia archaeon]
MQKINENRKRKGEKRRVSSESVNRVLMKLWLPLGISKTVTGAWKRGTGPIRGMTNVWPEIVDKIIADAKVDATPLEVGNWIGLGEEPTTHKAYICYPYHDNPLRRSLELLILLIHLYPRAKDSFVPATPHEMYWGLEERIDRETAMTKCEELIAKCDFLLYCLRKKDKPSIGMKRDMEVAKKKGIETKYIEDMLGYYPNVAEIMKECGLSEFAETPQVVSATAVR